MCDGMKRSWLERVGEIEGEFGRLFSRDGETGRKGNLPLSGELIPSKTKDGPLWSKGYGVES